MLGSACEGPCEECGLRAVVERQLTPALRFQLGRSVCWYIWNTLSNRGQGCVEGEA